MIQLDLFSDAEVLEPTVFDWLNDHHSLAGKKIHIARISGSFQQHYEGFITQQSLYQFDAPLDLVVYLDDVPMSLASFMETLTKKIMKKGSFYLTHEDCIMYIPETELGKLENPLLVQEKTTNPYSLTIALRKKYE